jgi:hypothetical protein
MPKLAKIPLVASLLSIVAASAAAQNLEPRAYANTPVGMNFAIVGYGYVHGSVDSSGSLPIKGADVEVNGAFLAYARSVDFWGKSGKIDVVLPYAWASGHADFQGESESRNVSGLGDAQMRVSVNLWGAPALDLEHFQSYEQDWIVGASLQVTAPVGQYESDHLLNISSHRWTFKPELGVSKSFAPLILEASIAGSFYTDNHEFLAFPDHNGIVHIHTRAQNPVGSAQAHAIYAFRSGIWGSLDFTYYAGGKNLVDGRAGRDLQENTRVGGTIAIPVNRYNSIKLFGSTGVTARAGGRFDSMGIAWQVRWGGGL